MSFWREQFDKLILLSLVLLFAWSAVHGSAYSQRVSDVFTGALIGLITGKAITMTGGPGNPTPPHGGQ